MADCVLEATGNFITIKKENALNHADETITLIIVWWTTFEIVTKSPKKCLGKNHETV